MSMLSQPTALAETKTPPSCKDVIAACDKALEKKTKELELADLSAKQSRAQAEALAVENRALQDSNNSLLRNPFAMTLLGIVVGGLAYSFLKK